MRAAGPTLLLRITGAILLAIGAAGIIIGLAFAEPVHALLPEISADADAVGGAAFALGLALGLGGIVHLVLAGGLRRPHAEWVDVAAVVLCALMAAVAMGWAVTALVSAASGIAPPVAMVPAALGLALLAGAYGWSGARLARARRRPSGGC